MSKVSPVMKHARRPLTAEQAEVIAVEEFINSIPPEQVMDGDTLIDNSIKETIDIPEEHSLDPIVDSITVANSLEDLAEDVESNVDDTASMESYQRIFANMTNLTGHPMVSLESFPATKGGKRRFVKAIRSHVNDIRHCVGIAIEDYIDKVDESIENNISHYKQALKALSEVREEDLNVDGKVTINYKRMWSLFHMDGKLMDLKSFNVEVDNIKKLGMMVAKGKDQVKKWQSSSDSSGNALEGKLTVDLMNNTRVVIKDGRSHWEKLPVPKPDKKWTAGDWFWIFMFNWAGLVYRIFKGGSGDDVTKKEQALKATSKIVSELKMLAPVVQSIAKDANEIIAMVEHANKDVIADVKRSVSPVLELAAKTIHHVTEVTYGVMKMFDAAESESKKE